MKTISIIIATLDRGEDLLELLSQLQKQQFFEAIIIDQTKNYTQKKQAELQFALNKDRRLAYYKVNFIGAGAARNFGASRAKGKYILFIDDDVILTKGFCSSYTSIINSETEFDAIAGMVLGEDKIVNNILPQKFYNRNVGFLFRPMNYGLRLERSDLGTCNMLIKKNVFDDIGGFDENLLRLEDSDFSSRFMQTNYISIYLPDIRLIHKNTPTGAVRSLLKNTQIYPDREYWKQYFYFTLKNFGLFRGWKFLSHYFGLHLKKLTYIKHPIKFLLAIYEIVIGYIIAKKMLRHARRL